MVIDAVSYIEYVDPETGEGVLVLHSTPVEIDPAQLQIDIPVDHTNCDPTIAAFHEPREGQCPSEKQ